MNRLREVTAGGYAMLSHGEILRLLEWHDGRCKIAPCWLLTTMSPGCFSWCSLLIPWKSKVTKTKSEVSNEYQIRQCKLLDNYLRQDLLENEPATVSTTKECTTVDDRVTERNSKAAVGGLILILPALSSNAHLHPGIASARNWTRDHHGNKGVTVYPCGVWGPRYGDKFQGGSERIKSHRWESCLLWHTFESRNRLKTARRSFPHQHSISWPSGKRP